MSRRLNVLMIPTSNSGTIYWRLFNWWVAAHRTGVANFKVIGWQKDQTDLCPWQIDVAQEEYVPQIWGLMCAAAREADVIIFQYVHTEAALNLVYDVKNAFPDKPVLCEIDDVITDVASYNPASNVFVPGSELMRAGLGHLEVADAVITTTPFLKEVYADRNEHIYVLPNSIDIPKWSGVRHGNKPGIRIGWAGGTSHDEDLRLLEKVIPAIVEAHKDVEFVFVSGGHPEFLKNQKRVRCVQKWARIDRYPQHLASQDFDIGIAPLVDNKFNRAKSNLRYLEYSALGIPTVASNVGHFAQTITHGIDGFLCTRPEDFVIHLNDLIRDKKYRKRIAAGARAKIAKDFNVDINVRKYVEVIEEIIARGDFKKPPSLMTGIEEAAAAPGFDMGPLEVETPQPTQEVFS